jgi:hypothetical protein
MKILYLLHKLELPCHQNIIDNLTKNGCEVDVELIGPAPPSSPWINVWTKINSENFIEECKKNKYDFIVSNTHSSYILSFASKVKPKYGYIDIEHDLFSYRPENFPNSFILTCTEKHSNWCETNERNFTRCRWPKLDAEYTKTTLSINRQTDAIFIGSYVFKKKKNINKYGFKNLWYKKYQKDDQISPQYKVLPEEFTGPIGIRNFVISDFLITQHSSCFVEALMLGLLPIMLPIKTIKVKDIDDILSVVRIANKPGVGDIKAITTENIETKIKLLSDDKILYNDVLAKMKAEWLSASYSSLPSAAEAMWDYIKGRSNA